VEKVRGHRASTFAAFGAGTVLLFSASDLMMIADQFPLPVLWKRFIWGDCQHSERHLRITLAFDLGVSRYSPVPVMCEIRHAKTVAAW
jgi:hypothetical protein